MSSATQTMIMSSLAQDPQAKSGAVRMETTTARKKIPIDVGKNRLLPIIKSRQEQNGPTIYGRDNEFKSLQDTFDRISNDPASASELVLLTGPSGSGKSTLFRSFTDWVRTERKSLTVSFGTGKYDELVNNEPYMAIVAASDDLCEQISDRGLECVHKFNSVFRQLAGGVEEARMLNSSIPGLRLLTGDDLSESEHCGTLSQALTRFKHLWRAFLRASTAVADVTVLFLDDLQWADTNSLDLINSLVTAKGLARAEKLLLVCAYRHEDDDSSDAAQEKMLRWCLDLDKLLEQDDRREMSGGHTFVKPGLMNTTVIGLHHLVEVDTNEVVCGLLYGSLTELNKTQELSRVIHSHAQGNPFYVRRYLDYLTVKGLIRTTDAGLTWEWDVDTIANQRDVPESVPDLMLRILAGIPEKMLNMLVTAAHIGHEFSPVLLEQESLSGSNQKGASELPIIPVNTDAEPPARSSSPLLRERARSTLDAAVKEGLLEKRNRYLYCFSHDHVQKSLYSMLVDKPQEQGLLHSKIGRTLLSLINLQLMKASHENASTARRFDKRDMFNAVDNLNLGAEFVSDPQERLHLVTLNLEASRLSLQKSAFVGAVKYARSGISLLAEDRWQSNYELCLDLYSLAARLEHCTGNFVRANLLINEIHRNGKTVLDRLPAYFTEIDVLGARGETGKALDLGVIILNQLGEGMSKRPGLFHVIFEMFRTSSCVKKTKQKGFLSLHHMKDPAKIAAMAVLSSVAMYAYVRGARNKNSFVVACLRMTRMTCRDGLSIHAPLSIVGFGSILAAMGSFKEAYEMAKTGLHLVEQIDGAHVFTARNLVPTYSSMALFAGHPLEEVLPQFLRAYHVGVAHGDVDYGYLGVLNHLTACYYLGTTPLYELNEEYEKYLSEMEEYQSNFAKWIVTALWQLVRNLSGKPLKGCGGGLDPSGFIAEMKAQKTPEMVPVIDHSQDILTKVILGTLGHANLRDDEHLVSFCHANVDSLHAHFARVMCCYGVGVSSFELLRQTGKRKYRQYFRRELKAMQAWYDEGVTVAVAPFLLLTAESLAESANKRNAPSRKQIERAYLDAAAAASGVSKCVMIEAYSYERLSQIVLPAQTKEYTEKAIEKYALWGATAKVVQLRGLLSQPFAESCEQRNPASGDKARKRQSMPLAELVGTSHTG